MVSQGISHQDPLELAEKMPHVFAMPLTEGSSSIDFQPPELRYDIYQISQSFSQSLAESWKFYLYRSSISIAQSPIRRSPIFCLLLLDGIVAFDSSLFV